MNSRKAGKGAVGRLDAADILAVIELRYLVPFSAADVCYIHCYFYWRTVTGRWRLHGKVVVAEVGVAEAKAEGKERLAIVVDVLMDTGRIAVVEGRKLAKIAREGNGEPACGIVISKKSFCDGLSAELARIPGFQDGRNVLLGPADR